jgi:hypothetical protein
MLSVGRELYIQDQPVICLECQWEGVGAELATGNLQAPGMTVYVVAYRCAACHSFRVRRKAKILTFPSAQNSENLEEPQSLNRSRL